MPIWLQWLIWIAAGVVALVTLWTKVIKPGAKLVSLGSELLPLVHELVKQFRDNPSAFGVLEEIAAEFRTDSGSTLRDVVNSLQKAANEAREAAAELRIKAQVLEEKVEVVKRLASEDRAADAHRLEVMNDLVMQVKIVSEQVKSNNSGSGSLEV